jgi:hypothetical protein
MFSGLPKNERWWFWCALVWIFFSLGPGLLVASKPVYIGYFPLLYVWSFAFWIISLVLIYILAFKLDVAQVPEDIQPEESEV